jgi:hypothetical protein
MVVTSALRLKIAMWMPDFARRRRSRTCNEPDGYRLLLAKMP